VLDLYAGTGALSFDALSRGAERAVLVEKDRAAAAAIRENASSLGVGTRIELLNVPVDKALQTLGRARVVPAFDLIFADPPYVRVTSPELALELGAAVAWLTPDGVLVLEHGKRDPAPVVAGLEWGETREYGDTHVSLGTRRNAEPSPGSGPASGPA
jgi:16S rRNA (guanine(966)-N(2))-methyltransferase RsmD